MPTQQQIARSPKYNLGILLITCILCTALLYFADYGYNPNSKIDIRASIVKIPAILTLIILVIYGLSRFIGKKYNWIITLLGILLMFYISLPIFFGAASR